MNFEDFLLSSYSLFKGSLKEAQISSISSHSRRVRKNSLFIAVKGRKTDGHNYLKQAIHRGAGTLLVADRQAVPLSFKGAVLIYKKEGLCLGKL
ncbi:MAG: Mur ligase domain-containing protein, partial [Oligoflexia bacterium]|nr:Mur ligase domain-containing protein [Oligoflexia bacterium]